MNRTGLVLAPVCPWEGHRQLAHCQVHGERRGRGKRYPVLEGMGSRQRGTLPQLGGRILDLVQVGVWMHLDLDVPREGVLGNGIGKRLDLGVMGVCH